MNLTPRVLTGAVLTLSLLAACGGGGAGSGPDAGAAGEGGPDAGAAGQGGPDAAAAGQGGHAGPACALAPTGAFTFHVQNSTAKKVVLNLGCGHAMPITVDTPAGPLPAAPGNVVFCEYTCDQTYAGMNHGCTDCGAGVWPGTEPGQTADLAWDRRGYVKQTLPSDCSSVTGECGLGVAVAPTTAQTGTLIVCDSTLVNSCVNPRSVGFTLDTTKNEGTIELR